ncbi:MAG: 4Fe-4S binding protein [Palaeococcus sp.]|uniref:pyruvate synthase subunit PorD n=1 Tax=Palaeococcus sp. (in: euryarchaeotes) TaxID=2820298 RepID=UPI0025F34AAA|nr:pyruvate synthase subunit PorD [Palaeococcus sp. (in: euryarchaeotes)]MCD6559879.1 4Fe-4S binding protein [Palaeococcus sp. (in: euryarchaeotes)]
MAESPFKEEIERVEKEYSEKMTPGAIVYIPGSSVINKTGSWRVFMPEFNRDKCVRCYLCYIYCPEPAIYLDEENNPVFDYDYCKGCGICANECPTNAILMVREKK